MNPSPEEKRLQELLLARALGDLDLGDTQELDRLAFDERDEPDEYELAAAAVYLALQADADPLPESLRQRVERRALTDLGHQPE